MNYRHVDTTANTVLFANPDNITATLRVKVASAGKTVGATKLTNVKSELKTITPKDVIKDESSVGSELVSITTTISGSLENKAAVKAEVLNHISNLQLILDDLVGGWKPAATAVLPTSLEE